MEESKSRLMEKEFFELETSAINPLYSMSETTTQPHSFLFLNLMPVISFDI